MTLGDSALQVSLNILLFSRVTILYKFLLTTEEKSPRYVCPSTSGHIYLSQNPHLRYSNSTGDHDFQSVSNMALSSQQYLSRQANTASGDERWLQRRKWRDAGGGGGGGGEWFHKR